jgi:oligoribonuclease NrnB/cAMP/cGMP phosphodiesterase (DHH superfamily)
MNSFLNKCIFRIIYEDNVLNLSQNDFHSIIDLIEKYENSNHLMIKDEQIVKSID